jgi:hypothetical protein
VSISGETAIVGAQNEDEKGTNSGSAYIFERVGGSWSEKAKLTASDGEDSDYFGNAVSISGDRAIVGAQYEDEKGTNSGSAFIFERVGGSWSQKAKLTASDGDDLDYFGYSVSISGDTAIVGAHREDQNGADVGSAYIFERDAGSWSELTKLTASDGSDGDNFGYSVSISGDAAIVGAIYEDASGLYSGSAYIFERDGGSWSEKAKLTASDGEHFDHFGNSVSISGDRAIVGAHYEDENGPDSGSAYIFERDGGSWSELTKLTASDGAHSDHFGVSVSISGDTSIVGASSDNAPGTDSGSAYTYSCT